MRIRIVGRAVVGTGPGPFEVLERAMVCTGEIAVPYPFIIESVVLEHPVIGDYVLPLFPPANLPAWTPTVGVAGGDRFQAPYRGPMDPEYPCREMPTRHCPALYEGVCGERPCARFQSEDETPWLPELRRDGS